MSSKTRKTRSRRAALKPPPRPKAPTNSASGPRRRRAVHHPTLLPHLLTADEVADLLRTSRKAIYAAVARGQLPGVVRLSRRILFDQDEVLSWLSKRRALSLEGHQR